jgi:hypothetical protein
MRKISATLAALLLICALMVSSATIVQAQDRDDRPQAERREGREEHPVIRQAIKQLQQTKYLLEHKAAHDFAGHRVQAIQSIDQAIEHLNQALRADKK